jgi:hypothetical protein
MNTKLVEFKRRNRKRNKHLYNTDAVKNFDYVECPESGERLSMIKVSYITNILGMSEIEYNLKYPEIKRICDKRTENIRKGLRIIDVVTGLSKHELSVEKSKKSLMLEENGVSGYKLRGEKTKNTHMLSVDVNGRNGYSRIAVKAIIKGNNTKAIKGLIVSPELRDEYYRYKTIVLHLTEKHRKTVTAGYKTGLAGTEDAWQMDHIMSIMDGYNNKISPYVIAHIRNLRMLPWKENLQKHARSHICISDLLFETGYDNARSLKEFDDLMQLIKEDIECAMPPTGAHILGRYHGTII